MRLSVFSPKVSTQLLVDLKKLYQGYFNEQQLSDASLQQLVETPNKQFFVTLFNARHLGAVQVSIQQKNAQLQLLCVRDLTRRRGVGKNLLCEVENQLQNSGVESVVLALNEISETEREGMKLFMQSCGYQLNVLQLRKSL